MYGKSELTKAAGAQMRTLAEQRSTLEGANAPTRMPEVISEHEALMHKLGFLTDRMGSLLDKLRPVLAERPTAESNQLAVPEPNCELGRRLRAASDAVDRLSARVDYLLDCLEV